MMQITDDDIKLAEQIFLPAGHSFDEQRRNFIKCLDESLHVQACPGSGKTTALLAKLFILSEKMPFENNQGISVLTHTNVAIDIIKKKLGDKANKLLSYPNFFGTIQSFVDKYLAIPAYIKCFGHRPSFIDNEFFRYKLQYFRRKLENNQWLQNNKGLYYDDVIDFVFYEVKLYDFNNEDFSLTISKLKNKESQTYITISDIFKNIILSGYLRYVDTYSLALENIKKYEDIKNIFSSRFKYVFIDEAQDTSGLQKEIIEACFNENVIIQWVGDVNQGIMQNDYEETAWKPDEGGRYQKMTFSTSYRISQPIADVVKNIAVDKYDKLDGNRSIDLKPILIVFNDRSICKVLEEFAKLLTTKAVDYDGEPKTILEISQISGNPIKAIGWVGKEKEKGLTIKSYFPDFDKQLTNPRKQYFPNLFTMCEISKNASPKEFKDRTLACIIEVLSQADKRYSKTEFINLLKEQYPEQNNILLEGIVKYNKDRDFKDFSKTIKDVLVNVFNNLSNNDKVDNYILGRQLKEISVGNQSTDLHNIYRDEINSQQISIYIDTVHGVKGETHTATLYLDSKFHNNSIEYFIEELKGNNSNLKSDNRNRKNKALRIAHVAFSRPTHLLSIAIYEEQYNKIKSKDLENKFEIIESM